VNSSRLKLLVLLTAISTCLLAAAPAAPAAPAPSPVRLGEAPPLPVGTAVTGPAPAGEELQLQVALEPSDPAALARFAEEVSDPGAPHFRDHLSVAQFAARFGAEPVAVREVRSTLEDRGLEVGPLTANRLSLPVTATVAEAEAAFATDLNQVELPDGATATANTVAPALPAAVADEVQAVVGLSDVSRAERTGDAGPAPFYAATAPPENAPVACKAAADKQAESKGSFVINEIAEAYDFDSIYAEKNEGEGQTVAVLEYEPFVPADIAAFQKCFETDVPLVEEDIEGGPEKYTGKPEQAQEADGDIEIILGLAPEIDKLIVYQGPSGANEVVMLERWVEKNEAKVLSSSWGGCEKFDDRTEQAAIGTRLQEAAIQGQTFLVAAGDEGSEDCWGKYQGLVADSPGTQPYATSVGGTRLADYKSTPRLEYIWSEGVEGGAGGGGVSEIFPMPSYQLDAAPSLGLIEGASSGVPCGADPAYCRQVPDVSANASLSSEYVIYNQGNWILTNGTSSATPVWAALMALTNASAPCKAKGQTVGFVNPALYAIAGDEYAANFNDIVSGTPGGGQSTDIRFGGTKPYKPKPGYDMASGLGTPIAGGLSKSLCGAAHKYTVSVTGPGDQLTIAGDAVSVQATATDSGGATLSFTATGLPAGLSIDPASGLITGTTRTPGLSHVTVSARDRYGNAGSREFTWTVGPGAQARRLLGAKIVGLAQGKPRLTVDVAANDGETLQNVAIVLPAGISAAPDDSDVRAGVGARDERARKLGARVSTPGKKIRLDFKRGAKQAHLRLSSRSLRIGDGLVRRARNGHLGALPVKIVVADTAGRGRLSTPLR
jgi:hypothetical protein